MQAKNNLLIRLFNRHLTVVFLLITGFLLQGELIAQDEPYGQTMPLFQSDDILDLTFEADFKAVFSNTDDSTYFPAFITMYDNDKREMTVEAEVRTRGITRRKQSICSFTPLRVKFPEKEMKNTPFEGQKAIKLVTHCNKSDKYEQNTVLEYLIYRAFNILTDSSFKVRPAMINYIFSDDKTDTIRKFAFFLEREKHLASRLSGDEYEAPKVHPDQLDPYQSCLVDMFEYMIGNTDYSLFEDHNIIRISDARGSPPYIPVPYDFDWSGLVAAPYAEPNPFIGTESVTERVYRGLKRSPEIVNRTIRLFNERKAAIYTLFENCQYLEEKEKKKAIKYLDDFYYTINNERLVKTEFFDNARQMNE